MRYAVVVGAFVVAGLLAVLFARALPAAVEREKEGRGAAVRAVCEQALRPTGRNPALGVLPSDAPAFTLKDYKGRDISLAQYRGRVVLVNLWATWCQTCIVEMPSLERLAVAEKKKPFSILAVTVDDGWPEVLGFFAGRGTQMTVLLDKDRSVPKAYGTEKFPESFLVDKEGKVRFYVVSDRNWSAGDIKACVDAMIEE